MVLHNIKLVILPFTPFLPSPLWLDVVSHPATERGKHSFHLLPNTMILLHPSFPLP